MRLFTDRNGKYVLGLSRTQTITKSILFKKGKRVLKLINNREFDSLYKANHDSPIVAALTWLDSTIKMAETARKELQMKVAIAKNKIVAHLNDDDVYEGAGRTYSREDLEGMTMKDLIKLFNTTLAPADRVKVLDGAEGNIIQAAEITWEAIANYEIPVKAEKVKKEKVERKVVKCSLLDNTVFVPLDNSQHRATSVRTTVFEALVAIGSGTAEEIAVKLGGDFTAKIVKGYLRPLCQDGKVEAKNAVVAG